MMTDFDHNPGDHRFDLRGLLRTELRWFMRLRWFAGAAILAGAVTQCALEGMSVPHLGFISLGAGVLLYNGAAWWADRRWPALHEEWRNLLRFAAAQIYLDLATLTILATLTGGLRSPYVLFFVPHMVFAGMLQPRRWAYACAVILIAMLFGALAVSGQLPVGRDDTLLAAALVATLAGVVYLTDRLARALYRRERSRLRHHRQLRRVTDRLRAQQAAMIQHEKMAAMGRLAAGVAHEINNPLSNMDSVLQLMQRSRSAPPESAVTALRDQIQRIHETVRQLTAFAHPDTGRREVASAGDIVRASLKLLDFERRLDAIEIDLRLTEEDDRARVSANAVQQVVMNLILNAVDALTETPEPRLELRTRRVGSEVRIEVVDNGPGVPPDSADRIFEPFFTTKPVGKGTGLGLSISLALVREQGGSLECGRGLPSATGDQPDDPQTESDASPQAGAAFTIRLPAHAHAPAPAASPPPSATPILSPTSPTNPRD